MKIKYNNTNDMRDEQFVSLFAFGIVHALKENLITCDDAWNWFLNIRTLDFLESVKFNKSIINAIHLSTELENVKRIIPNAFESSCDEILKILTENLKKNKFDIDEIDYLLEVNE